MNIEQSAKFLAELAKSQRFDAIEKTKYERDSLCIYRRGTSPIECTANELAEAFSKIAPDNNLAQFMKETILDP